MPLQAEEAQRLRKRKKAEAQRLLDMQRRQKERIEEVRETQKKVGTMSLPYTKVAFGLTSFELKSYFNIKAKNKSFLKKSRSCLVIFKFFKFKNYF